MAPASRRHSIIKRDVLRALDRALEGNACQALVDGPQILTDEISAIPDDVVTCTALDLSTPVIAEPVIIVEVMSPGSEADDTGRKWLAYRKIPSLRHYLVLAQDRRLVHIHSRAGDIWRERFVSEAAVQLDDPSVRLEVDALYVATDLAA
jgi:Uma2 family endonuclease